MPSMAGMLSPSPARPLSFPSHPLGRELPSALPASRREKSHRNWRDGPWRFTELRRRSARLHVQVKLMSPCDSARRSWRCSPRR